MKKNYMMRLAAVLLVLVLLSTCVISGTFAKYVTELEEKTDTAQVAAWGVEFNIESEAFAAEYATDDASAQGEITLSVDAEQKVVAPGTTAQMFEFTATGTPEVAFSVAISFELTLTAWEDENGDFYCPLEITVGSETFKGLDYDSAAEFVADVKGAVEDKNANYAANTNVNALDLTVSWAWAFSNGDANDAKDTFLGNQAAAGNPAIVTYTFSVIVTQID